MTKINTKKGIATLSLADSIVWAGSATSDGRVLYETRRRVLDEVQAAADKAGRAIEIYSCKRHGECVLEVVEPTI